MFILNIEQFKIIKQAIINEIEGYEFYKMAASNTTSPEAKVAFDELASEEFSHVTWLKNLYEKGLNSEFSYFDFATLPAPPSPKIFKWENLDRKNASLEVSVLGIGIEMERASVKFYKEASANTDMPEAKKLFNMLESWEQVHLEQFSSYYNELKESWWSSQGYEPF